MSYDPLCLVHVSNSRPIPARYIILCGPREHIICLIIKIYAALYRKLWKCVSVTQISASIWRSIYMQKWTLVCRWYAEVKIRGRVFLLMTTAWFLYSQRNKTGLITGRPADFWHFWINQHRPIMLQIRPINIKARLQATRDAASCGKQIAIPPAHRITLWCPPLPANFLKRELPGNCPRKG